jgi:hypothetical protein
MCQMFQPNLNESGRKQLRALILIVCCTAAMSGEAQQQITIPAAHPMRVTLQKSAPMRLGAKVTASTADPVYVGGTLVIPAGTTVLGHVMQLPADTKRRINARLHGDFTPYHKPQVQFDAIMSPSGAELPLRTTPAEGTATVMLTASASSKRGSYFHQAWQAMKNSVEDSVHTVTAPGKADRLRKAAYGQLPYHPEEIDRGVSYAFDLAGPVEYPLGEEKVSVSKTSGHAPSPLLKAYLRTAISSKDTKAGDEIEAETAEPFVDEERHLRIPQGSVISGVVRTARPARKFGRSGQLMFTFTQVHLQAGVMEQVQGNVETMEAAESQDLQVDVEGGVRPRPKAKLLYPLATAVLANAALDGEESGNSVGRDALASNGLGLVGRIVGITSGSRAVAAGIGFYAAGLSVYSNYIARGKDVSFARNTRVEIEVRRRQGTPLNVPGKIIEPSQR